MAGALTDLAGATRLARAIATDLALYNHDAIARSLRDGRPFAGMEDELLEARRLYLGRVCARLDPVPLLVRALQEMFVRRAAQQGLPTEGLAEALAARLHRGERLALLVVDGPHEPGRIIPLGDGVQAVGRAAPADIVIAVDSIARRHARLVVDGAWVEVQDLESTCGILVNDTKVRSAPLSVGDRLRLGTVGVTLIRVAAVDPTIEPTHGTREAAPAVHQRGLVLDALAAALARGGPLALVLCQLDHHDRITERHGEAVGDEVLVTVAARLTAAARALAGRVVGRYAGAFVVVLPGQDAAVRAHAEALRIAATGEPVATRDGQVQASLSIGVTDWQDTDATRAEALLERAWAAFIATRSRPDRAPG